MLKGLDICDLKHSSGYAAVPRLETWNLAPLVIPMAGVRMGYSSQTNHVRGPAPIQLSFPLTCIKVSNSEEDGLMRLPQDKRKP
ncbi:hypothetical protein V6N11_021034 [Hibiscus sabdariffa]|uniref:Uncharacterized protein n=1 Tax=Hibiscus sabdariffa TaxID=183260 RepID=A0ABR1ZFK4_9ROSI